MVLGPGINIDRDPRWGRNFEMFSEDPLLTSALGTADIEGIQSQGVMADVKHFVTYNQETNRGTPNDDTIVNTRALHEIYLPPFYGAIVQAHAASVMCAYPLLNGVYSCQNPSLLTGLLDQRWGFAGFVRTDSDANASTVDSANAGLDQERGSFFWDNGQLAAAVAAGQVRTSTINEAVRRILTQMFQFNLFNDPLTGNLSSPAATPADNAFAQNVAQRGTVLLQNTGNVLPLSTATTKFDRGHRSRRHHQSANRRHRQLLCHALVGDQPAQRHHRPRRVSGDRHLVLRHRSDSGRRRRRASAGRDRVRELLGG